MGNRLVRVWGATEGRWPWSWEAGKGWISWGWDQEERSDLEDVPNLPFPLAASASSEDIVIEEFTRQEPGAEDTQEVLAAEGDKGDKGS